MGKKIEQVMDDAQVDQTIRNSFMRIARSRNGNGKRQTSGQILEEGVEMFREEFLGKKETRMVTHDTLIRYFVELGAVPKRSDGIDLCKKIPHGYELEYKGGRQIYFERVDGSGEKMVVGYRSTS